MSVIIYWRPVPPKDGRYLNNAHSGILEALKHYFGDENGRITLKQSDITALRAMEIAYRFSFGSKDESPYGELAQELETHGAIEVWGEW